MNRPCLALTLLVVQPQVFVNPYSIPPIERRYVSRPRFHQTTARNEAKACRELNFTKVCQMRQMLENTRVNPFFFHYSLGMTKHT